MRVMSLITPITFDIRRECFVLNITTVGYFSKTNYR